MKTLSNVIAVIAAFTPLWAMVHPDFIPLAVTVAPLGITYLLQTSRHKEDSKEESKR
ncbi:hypothetical protein [Nostoc sp.]